MNALTRLSATAFVACAVMIGLITVAVPDAHAVSASVAITQSDTVAGIQGRIEAAMNAARYGDTITVTGSKSDAASMLTISIPAGVTLLWKANYSGWTYATLVYLAPGGEGNTFELASGASLSNSYSGNTLSRADTRMTTRIAGTLSNTGSGTALYYRGLGRTSIEVSGTITATGFGRGIHTDDFTDQTTITVTGTVENTANGEAIYAPKAEVNVSSGRVGARAASAINALTVTVRGGTVTSTGSNPTISTQFALISGGRVENTGSGNAITTKTAEVTGGTIVATTGVAIAASGAAMMSGGVAFAYGMGTTGASNVIRSDAGTPVISGSAVVIAWNKPSGTPTYTEGTTTGLSVSSGATAGWALNGSQPSIKYSRGSNTGYITISGIVISKPATPVQPTTSRPASTTAQPTTSRPASTTANPTTSRPASTTANPTTSRPASTTANPTTSRPPSTTSRPSSTTAQPTTSRPASTTARPTSTPTQTSSAKPTSTPTRSATSAQYQVTVNSGVGSGRFSAGQPVTITANSAPTGQVFSSWTTTSGVVFNNASNQTTTFIMSAKAVSVTATYTDAPDDSYALAVSATEGGTANASVNSAKEGDIVLLEVTIEEGYLLDCWLINGVAVTLDSDEFVMPNYPVTLMAMFVAIPNDPDSLDAGQPIPANPPADSEDPDSSHASTTDVNKWVILLGVITVLAGVGGLILFIVYRRKNSQDSK